MFHLRHSFKYNLTTKIPNFVSSNVEGMTTIPFPPIEQKTQQLNLMIHSAKSQIPSSFMLSLYSINIAIMKKRSQVRNSHSQSLHHSHSPQNSHQSLSLSVLTTRNNKKNANAKNHQLKIRISHTL